MDSGQWKRLLMALIPTLITIAIGFALLSGSGEDSSSGPIPISPAEEASLTDAYRRSDRALSAGYERQLER